MKHFLFLSTFLSILFIHATFSHSQCHIDGETQACLNTTEQYEYTDQLSQGYSLDWMTNMENVLIQIPPHSIEITWNKPGNNFLMVRQIDANGEPVPNTQCQINVQVSALRENRAIRLSEEASRNRVCEGESLQFQTPLNVSESRRWTVDGVELNESGQSITHTFTQAGDIDVCVSYYDAICQTNATCLTITVYDMPITEPIEIVGIENQSNVSLCLGQEMMIQNGSEFNEWTISHQSGEEYYYVDESPLNFEPSLPGGLSNQRAIL